MGEYVKSPSAICFDIGGTILDTGAGFTRRVMKSSSHGILQDEWNRCVNLSRGPLDDALRLVAERFRVPLDIVYSAYRETTRVPPRPYADVVPCLDALDGLLVIALSNTSSWLADTNLGGLANRFNRIFYSFEIGFAKPNLEAFNFVCEAMNLQPSELVMVGDSWSYDIAPARAVGWHAVHLARRGNGRPQSLTSLRDLPSLVLRIK